MDEEQLNSIIDSVQFVEELIGGKINFVGIIDDFAIIETVNAYILIVSKSVKIKIEDKGYYYYFKSLPRHLSKIGIKCSGYYIEHENNIILIAPRDKCAGSIRFAGPKKERIGAKDVLMTSLLSMFDDESGYIKYRGKIVGVLSTNYVSPLADLALITLEKLIKAGAQIVKINDRVLETRWLKRIKFGVKPIIFNKIEIDFEELERRLAMLKIQFTQELTKIRKLLDKFIDDVYETIVEYFRGPEKFIGKAAVVAGKLSDYEFRIVLSKLLTNLVSEACYGEDAFNISLAIIADPVKICLSNKMVPKSKMKINEIDTLTDAKLHPLLTTVSMVTGLGDIMKFKVNKYEGIAIKGSQGDLTMVALAYKSS